MTLNPFQVLVLRALGIILEILLRACPSEVVSGSFAAKTAIDCHEAARQGNL